MTTVFRGWKDAEDLVIYPCLHCCRNKGSIIGGHYVDNTPVYCVRERRLNETLLGKGSHR